MMGLILGECRGLLKGLQCYKQYGFFLQSVIPEKIMPRTFIKIKYITKALIVKIGMYFKPLLILPFSTMDTIREEKNEIVIMVAMEKYLKLVGSMATWLTVNGKAPTLAVVDDNLDTNPRIIVKRLKDRAKSRGAITITIDDINII